MKNLIFLLLILISTTIFAKECLLPLPSEDFYLSKPRSLDVDDHFIFIADENNNCFFRINKYDHKNILKIGEKGKGPGELLAPDFIAVRDSVIYVNNRNNGNISLFNIDGEYLNSLNIISFGYIIDIDNKHIYSMPSYKTNFNMLIDKYDVEGNYLESFGETSEPFKSESDFYKRLGSMEIDDNYLYFSFMFNKYQILKFDLLSKKASIINYPQKLKIEKPDTANKSESSGVFIVNSDITVIDNRIYILSVLDEFYAATSIDVFSKNGNLIEKYKLRDKDLSDEELTSGDNKTYIYFAIDNDLNFYFIDLVYNASLDKYDLKDLVK